MKENLFKHEHIPNSFLGMVEVKEKTPGLWEPCGEGDGERPLLHKIRRGVRIIVTTP